MYEMNDEEKTVRAQQKALHTSVRTAMKEAVKVGDGQWHRYLLLAWGFLRGFKYRRIERSHHITSNGDGSFYEHNLPNPNGVLKTLQTFVPEVQLSAVSAWLTDLSGAIPSPVRPPKVAFVREEHAAAE